MTKDELLEALAELYDIGPLGGPIPWECDGASYGRGANMGWDKAVKRCIALTNKLSVWNDYT